MPEAWRTRRAPAAPLLLDGAGLRDLRRGSRHAGFEAWCAAHPGHACVLWLGSGGLSDLVAPPDPTLQGSAARREWAQRVWLHYHGEVARGWPLLAWHLHDAQGVTAWRGPAPDLLREQAARHGVRLLGVRPLWPALLARLRRQQRVLRRAVTAHAELVEADPAAPVLTTVTLCRGAVTGVQRRRLATSPGDTRAADARLRVGRGSGAGQDPVATEALDDASLADLLQRTAAPDFLQPVPRPSSGAWIWLGAAGLGLALASVDAGLAWRAREQALALAVPTAPARVRGPAGVSAAEGPHGPAALLQRRLDHPWREVFLACEAPAAAGLAWLGLEHRAGGELRLQGLAADSAAVQRAAAALRTRPAWHQVLVARVEHEAGGDRFEIVARPPEGSP